MTSRPFITLDSAPSDQVPRSLPNQGRTIDTNRESVRKYVGLSEAKPLEASKALEGNFRAPRRQLNQSQNVSAINASFARQRQVFLSSKQNATSDHVTVVLPKRAGDKAAVNDEPRNPVPHNANSARLGEELNVSRDSVVNQPPKDSGGDSSHRSQPKTSTGFSARSSGKATDDAFMRFQARLNGQGSSLPDPMANLTENTRKKLSMVHDRSYTRTITTHSNPKSASVGTSIVPPSTSNEGMAQNPFANPQALKTELSTGTLNIDKPRLNPQAIKTELSIRNLNIEQPRQQAEASVQEQSIRKELSGRDDFNTKYRSKYKGISAFFDTLHGSTEASPSENQLFRRLGEAYIMEDIDEFERVYDELLRLVGKLGVAASK